MCLLITISAPSIGLQSWHPSTSSTPSPWTTCAAPRDGWNVSQLLAHMTVQHRGFAAAARGDGADPARWDTAAVADAVAVDPAGTYAAAAADVLAAFTDDAVLGTSF